GLVASEVDLKSKDLRTASMIQNGTGQRFAEHGSAIQQNAAATEALRGRMGDIDQYSIMHTTNVHFDTGKAALSAQGEADLCATAAQAEAIDNALLLVVGYTDSTGSQEFNQELSEKRAGRVINYLQQNCGWKPYRMLTPTGMSEADPLASNDTAQGKAQNRRVAVNMPARTAIQGLEDARGGSGPAPSCHRGGPKSGRTRSARGEGRNGTPMRSGPMRLSFPTGGRLWQPEADVRGPLPADPTRPTGL